MILVTAANGNQGKLLVPKLLAAGLSVRACVRSEASGQALAAIGVDDIVVGDIADPALLARAMRGVEKVYHVGPTAHPQERAMGFAAIEAARAAGVRHFVFSSVLHAIATDLVQHEIKRDIEEYLLSSGLEYTILQPSNYMSPLKLRPVFEQGVFRLSWSLDRRQSLVDLGDVTDVALMALTDSGRHAAATYELAAPGRYTGHDLAAIIGSVLGRPVQAEEIDADTYLKEFFGDVGPEQFPHEAHVLRAISAHYSAHDFVGNPNVLTWLLGREPTSYEQFVRTHHEAFRRTGSMVFSTAR
nr:NmrA family NAD(P)-binding protein [Sphingomonas sp. Y57]